MSTTTATATTTSTTATGTSAAIGTGTQQHHEHSNNSSAVPYHIKIDSPYLQPLRDEILLLPEENSGANSATTGSAPTTSIATAATGTPRTPSQQQQPAQQQQQQQRRPVGASNLPKTAEICTPGAAGSVNLASNISLLMFSPKSAGAYSARVIVCGVSQYCTDVRCYDVKAVVTAPAIVTELVFR
jgi:hypothetical protein